MLLLYLRISAVDRTLRCLIRTEIMFLIIFCAGFAVCERSLQFLFVSVSAASTVLASINYKVIMLSSVVSVTSDCYILLGPIKGVPDLQLSIHRKLDMFLEFLTGLL